LKGFATLFYQGVMGVAVTMAAGYVASLPMKPCAADLTFAGRDRIGAA
jgi:hypothetical protein